MRLYYLLISVFFYGPLPTYCLTWSSPTTLYSSDSYDGLYPVLSVYPTIETATAAWIAEGSGTTIYANAFTNGSWGTMTSISASPNTQASLNLVTSAAGVVLACDLLDDEALQLGVSYTDGNGMWTPLQQIHDFGSEAPFIPLSLAEHDSTSIISWKGSDQRMYAMTYSSGTAGLPYAVSDEGLSVVDLMTCGNRAIFATSQKVYATTLVPDPVNTVLLPRRATPTSLALDSLDGNAMFALQDAASHYLISAFSRESLYRYSIIATLNTSVSKTNLAVTSSGKALAAWELSTGEIQAAYFDGSRWKYHTTLSNNGSSPSAAFDPVTGHFVVVWADLVAGGTLNTIQTASFRDYTWSSPEILSSTGASFTNPHVRIFSNTENTTSTAIVIWSRKETNSTKAVIESTHSE